MVDIQKFNADFELTVYSVLTGATNQQEEQIIPHGIYQSDLDSRLTYDFRLPKGCDKLSWTEETFIEIKIKYSLYAVKNILRQANAFKKLRNGCMFVIITCNDDDCSKYQKFIDEARKDSDLSINDKIQVTSLQSIVSVHKELYNYEVNKYVQFFSNYKAKEDEDNKESNEAIRRTVQPISTCDKKEMPSPDKLEVAKEIFNLHNNTLFLGAGVSSSARMPGWNELMKSLLKNDNGKKPFELINEASYNSINKSVANSAIVTGRYIVDGYIDEYQDDVMTEVTRRIRHILYSKSSVEESALLKQLAKMVCCENKIIRQVITYNYDNLLEQYIDKNIPDKTNEPFYISIYDSQRQRDIRMPIYHVHGLIEEETKDTVLSNAEPILSEKAYHQLFNSLQSWVNVIQLNALYTSHCFFVGFSMTDPNQRRLLDMAAESEYSNILDKDVQSEFGKSVPHFVFMKKDGLEGEASNQVNQEHWKHTEYLMSQFGLNVVWFDEFEHLPELLKYISGELKDAPEWYKTMQGIE